MSGLGSNGSLGGAVRDESKLLVGFLWIQIGTQPDIATDWVGLNSK
jgi:hypothetical protein